MGILSWALRGLKLGPFDGESDTTRVFKRFKGDREYVTLMDVCELKDLHQAIVDKIYDLQANANGLGCVGVVVGGRVAVGPDGPVLVPLIRIVAMPGVLDVDNKPADHLRVVAWDGSGYEWKVLGEDLIAPIDLHWVRAEAPKVKVNQLAAGMVKCVDNHLTVLRDRMIPNPDLGSRSRNPLTDLIEPTALPDRNGHGSFLPDQLADSPDLKLGTLPEPSKIDLGNPLNSSLPSQSPADKPNSIDNALSALLDQWFEQLPLIQEKYKPRSPEVPFEIAVAWLTKRILSGGEKDRTWSVWVLPMNRTAGAQPTVTLSPKDLTPQEIGWLRGSIAFEVRFVENSYHASIIEPVGAVCPLPRAVDLAMFLLRGEMNKHLKRVADPVDTKKENQKKLAEFMLDGMKGVLVDLLNAKDVMTTNKLSVDFFGKIQNQAKALGLEKAAAEARKTIAEFQGRIDNWRPCSTPECESCQRIIARRQAEKEQKVNDAVEWVAKSWGSVILPTTTVREVASLVIIQMYKDIPVPLRSLINAFRQDPINDVHLAKSISYAVACDAHAIMQRSPAR